MFWCAVSLYIFTGMYFDSPYGLAKYGTTSKNIQRYYTPKHLIRYIYYVMIVAYVNRGYYTVARRYEFYVRVARTISHE